ncbi:FAD-dependent monooxygenase [Blastococcus brunescens]|uniref:FAD-dependent monooxygenase n=1 Tax=Blastococcus brunescens TaxID=1564165 RepID=UPI003BEED361
MAGRAGDPGRRGARLRAQNDAGDVLEIEAEHVVGCDGSRSLVRSAAGITETGRTTTR